MGTRRSGVGTGWCSHVFSPHREQRGVGTAWPADALRGYHGGVNPVCQFDRAARAGGSAPEHRVSRGYKHRPDWLAVATRLKGCLASGATMKKRRTIDTGAATPTRSAHVQLAVVGCALYRRLPHCRVRHHCLGPSGRPATLRGGFGRQHRRRVRRPGKRASCRHPLLRPRELPGSTMTDDLNYIL